MSLSAPIRTKATATAQTLDAHKATATQRTEKNSKKLSGPIALKICIVSLFFVVSSSTLFDNRIRLVFFAVKKGTFLMAKAQQAIMLIVGAIYKLTGDARKMAQTIVPQVAELQAQIDGAQSEIDNLSSSKAINGAVNRVVEAVKKALSLGLDPKTATNGELKAAFKKVNVEHKKRTRNLIDELAHAGEAKCRAEREADKEATKREDLTAQIATLTTQRDALQTQSDEYTAIADESDALFAQLTSGEVTQQAAQKEVDALNARYNAQSVGVAVGDGDADAETS